MENVNIGSDETLLPPKDLVKELAILLISPHSTDNKIKEIALIIER